MLCYVSEAIAIAERENFPLVGMSTNRRVLNTLCKRYCDAEIKAGVCFVCSQIRTTMSGYPSVDLDQFLTSNETCSHEGIPKSHCDIDWYDEAFLRSVEAQNPGTLHNNCGYDLWKKRYVDNANLGEANPLRRAQPAGEFLSEWAIDVCLGEGHHATSGMHGRCVLRGRECSPKRIAWTLWRSWSSCPMSEVPCSDL